MSEARTRWLFLLVGAALFALTYGNSLGNSFHYDDYHSIVENPHIRDLGQIVDEGAGPTSYSSMPERGMFRPLVVVSLALNYAVGGYELGGYHLVNLAVHLVCTVLVAWLCLELGLPSASAAVAAALFALHPVQSEVANYVSSRSESLAALGYLAALASYLRWRRIGGAWLAVISVTAYGLGLLAKSTAVSLPLLVIVHEFLAADRRRARRPFPWPLLGAYLVAMTGYIAAVRGFATAALISPVRPLYIHLLTQLKALVYYVWLLAAPTHLTVEHQFAVSGSISDVAVLLSAALVVSLAAVIALLVGKWGAEVCLHLGIWAAVVILPASLVPLNVLVNEHRLYLTLAFLAPAGAVALLSVSASGYGRWVPAIATIALLATLTRHRNRVWASELSLWRDAAAKAPAAYRAHMHLGGALEKRGDSAAALACYERAVQLAPATAEAHYNMANGLRLQGRPAEAHSAYSRALSLDPTFVPAMLNLAALERERGQLAEAEKLLLRAAAMQPASGDIQRRIGLVYRAQGRWQEAEAALVRALELEPHLAETHYNLANLFFSTHRFDRAAGSYRQALALAESHAGARYNLVDLLVRQRKYGQAETIAAEGLRRFPGQVKLHYPLAQAQEGLGRIGMALDSYRRFLTLSRVHPEMKQRIEAHIRELRAVPPR